MDFGKINLKAKDYDVWSFGASPVKIELMTAVKGLDFEEAFKIAQFYKKENISIRFLHLNSLTQSNKASGHYKDLDDIEQLNKR